MSSLLDLFSKKEKTIICGVFMGAILTTSAAVTIGLYIVHHNDEAKRIRSSEKAKVRNLEAKLNLVETKVEKLETEVEEGKNKIKMLSGVVGEPLGYQVYVDYDGDSFLDRITPLKSGFFQVEISKKDGSYETPTTYSSELMKDLVYDYYFKTGFLINPNKVHRAIYKHPEVICHVQKLAIDYGFLTQSTKKTYNTAFKIINAQIKPKKIDCSKVY